MTVKRRRWSLKDAQMAGVAVCKVKKQTKHQSKAKMVYGSVLKCISNLQTNPTHLAMCCVGPADTSVSRQGRLFVVMRGGSSSARVLCKTIVPGAKRVLLE